MSDYWRNIFSSVLFELKRVFVPPPRAIDHFAELGECLWCGRLCERIHSVFVGGSTGFDVACDDCLPYVLEFGM